MFRTIFNQAKRPFDLSALTAGYCTKAPVQRRLREVNEVRLVGTLMTNPQVLESGRKSLLVRTIDAPSKYSVHTVYIKTESNLTAGQRVCVRGKLSSAFQTLDTGKMVTRSLVKGSTLYVLENESASSPMGDGSTKGDQNRVDLLAHIASDIIQKDNHSSFAVSTHFKQVDPEKGGEESEGVNFHRIFVYDERLIRYIQNHLNRSDRVLLSGRIDHLTHTSGTDGKRFYSGFIVADNIYRIARRTRTHAIENNDEVKAEN